jgi:hypothetical protein
VRFLMITADALRSAAAAALNRDSPMTLARHEPLPNLRAISDTCRVLPDSFPRIHPGTVHLGVR